MDKYKIALIGCGAQAKYAVEIMRLTGRSVAAVFDPLGKKVGGGVGGCVIEPFEGETTLNALDDSYGVIVCAADADLKRELFASARRSGLKLENAIHPMACVADGCKVGEGVIINPMSVIQPNATIGDGAMIHAGAIVEHDCVLEDFVNIGPRAALAGWVKVESGATVFTGACVIPKVVIGRDAVVAAGAAVITDVRSGAKVAGVPAREI